MIDIAELSETALEDIKDIIEDENSTEYEIYVPKSTQLFSSEKSAIAYDYAYAAYSGQLLATIALSFEYEYVGPEVHASIGFTVKVNDKEALAGTILKISYLYVNDHENPEYDPNEEVNLFLEKVQNDEIAPACPDFVELFFEYIEEADEEENEDLE